jgi:arylsulfatase A-like enzyme/Flp pilus assembly protein TadD
MGRFDLGIAGERDYKCCGWGRATDTAASSHACRCVTLPAMRPPRLVLDLLLLCASAAAQSPPPDVYLITLDTLRADRVGCFGAKQAQTPALDRLCRDGVRFPQAFTPSPITNTSHATILTGLLPSRHGVTDFAVPLAPDKPALAAALKAAGYRTGAFIGAIILDSKSLAPGFGRGFDFYYDFPAKPAGKSRYGRVERRGLDVVKRAEQWVAATKGPRFAWLHLYDPHDPYDPPPPFAARFAGRLYDGEVAYTDSAVARFLGFLEAHEMYRDAIVLVVGDHGEGLGEHGEDTHGIFLYDSTLHVPLIIKLPKNRAAGTAVATQVRTTDIAPTIYELLALPQPAGLDGTSLAPLWNGQPADRVALAETDYPLRFGWAPLRAVRAGGQKYIEAPRAEFYDLKADPGETKNVYEPWNEDVQRLRKALADAKLSSPAQSSSAVPAATVAELKALGYFPEMPGETTAREPSLLPDPKDHIAEQNLLHRAMMAEEDGDAAAARQALEKVLTLDPKSYFALAQLGRLELDAGDFRAAAPLLARAREQRPTDAAVAAGLGRAQYELGQYAEGRAALEASLQLLPGQADARTLLGATLIKLKDYAAAEDQLEAAALIAPKRAEIFELQAEAYRAAGKPQQAQKAAARAASLRAAKPKS